MIRHRLGSAPIVLAAMLWMPMPGAAATETMAPEPQILPTSGTAEIQRAIPDIDRRLATDQSSASASESECDTTEPEPIFDVVAPVAGEHPIWVTAGATLGERWCCADCGLKTLWVAARLERGDLVVRGRRLDGPGEVSFVAGARPRSRTLVIPDAHDLTQQGAAPESEYPDYSFWPGAAYYSHPGCWELLATYGDEKVRIVQYLEDESDTPECREWIEGLEREHKSPERQTE